LLIWRVVAGIFQRPAEEQALNVSVVALPCPVVGTRPEASAFVVG
jgi:hypothetical protein